MMTLEIRSDLIKHSDEYVHALMTDKEASKYMLAYGRVCSVMEHTRPFSILPASCKDT